jgi:hypothetical protein
LFLLPPNVLLFDELTDDFCLKGDIYFIGWLLRGVIGLWGLTLVFLSFFINALLSKLSLSSIDFWYIWCYLLGYLLLKYSSSLSLNLFFWL